MQNQQLAGPVGQASRPVPAFFRSLLALFRITGRFALNLSTVGLIGLALLVALVISSRNLASFWTVIYKLVIGAVAMGVCLFVMEKVNTTDEIKWFSSFVAGILISLVATGVPWK
jgi:hypothetical protein